MLPEGFAAGHFTDRTRWTGCTAILPPAGCVAAAEVRGGGPGTREFDLLTPAANAPGVQALLFTGGSAYGLGAADGVVGWLAERGLGYPTRAGVVPLVSAVVVFDLPLGERAWPDAAAGRAACEAARGGDLERGSVGAGTGCSVGKLLGGEYWTKGGVGVATMRAEDATLTAIAVVNAAGEVVGTDGAVLAGVWRDGRYHRTADLLAAGERPPEAMLRENTTLVAVLTDAALDKRAAWLVARAGTAGVARAVDPSATPVDGDAVVCLASGLAEVDPFVLAVLAAEVTAAAIRDAVLAATGAPGCPAASERAA
jgi:L-aminopeptidase/D-esterase-like protein